VALATLEHNILRRTDGCALAGSPDKTDWIKDCAVQEKVSAELLEIIALLPRQL
jgi:hypothetical protein